MSSSVYDTSHPKVENWRFAAVHQCPPNPNFFWVSPGSGSLLVMPLAFSLPMERSFYRKKNPVDIGHSLTAFGGSMVRKEAERNTRYG
jgi:hypothetical protein